MDVASPKEEEFNVKILNLRSYSRVTEKSLNKGKEIGFGTISWSAM
jgi:hypothetical protein